MTPLAQQIQNVDTQLDILVAGDENRVAIKEYEKFFEQFFPIVGKLDDSCKKRKVLKNIPSEYLDQQTELIQSFKNNLATTKSVLHILLEKWLEDDYTVTQDDSFDNTIQAMKSLTKVIVVTNKEVWNTWTDYLLDSFNRTDAELNNIEKIDKYRDTYNAFVKERTSFKSKIANLPTEIDQIKEIQELSNRLQILMKDVNVNLSEEVKRFLDCIDDVVKGKKAPLSLLTPEVLKWIQDENEMSSFAITRSSGYR